MAIPDLIEILPQTEPVRAEITVPGSKSITNRALILAALSEGVVTLEGALWSEDTQIMAEGLRTLGFDVAVEPDLDEECNRTIRVIGLAGKIPRSGTAQQPLELFVGNAGTAARFLSALVCLGSGFYRLSGVSRMHQRPQLALFEALRQLGYRVVSEQGNDKLPVVIQGSGPREGACSVQLNESSQFASALLMGAQRGGWRIQVEGEDPEESPYVAMTMELIQAFPARGGTFRIEPDASSGSYFWAAHFLGLSTETFARDWKENARPVVAWPVSDWQIDASFPRYLPLPPEISREGQLGDSIMTAIALGPFTKEPVRFTELGRLRLQECERVVALRTELTKCGARVVEEGDTLTVYPSRMHGAEIETYGDHRMAMCFTILGLKVPGIKIKNPACVKKTFPNFFQKLAAPPPRGLGIKILDGHSGGFLETEDLFAGQEGREPKERVA